jgi:hypothetical protein
VQILSAAKERCDSAVAMQRNWSCGPGLSSGDVGGALRTGIQAPKNSPYLSVSQLQVFKKRANSSKKWVEILCRLISTIKIMPQANEISREQLLSL